MTETQGVTPATRVERAPNFDIRFPPLPRTIGDVTKLVAERHDVPETPRLIEIVNSDPVIVGSVLRRINSAYYGVRRRIGDIHRAVHLLGFDEVCDIVLTAGMMRLQDILHSYEQTKIFDQVMRMSVGTAAFAKQLAAQLSLSQQSSAFTLGLLHTCGRLVLLYNRPDDYEALWYTNDSGFAPTVASEQIIFGTDHAELGSMAADNWHLPDFIIKVIRHYQTPGHLDDEELRILALTLSVSANACEQLCLPSSKVSPRLEPTAALYLLARATDRTWEEMVEMVERDWREIADYAYSMVNPAR